MESLVQQLPIWVSAPPEFSGVPTKHREMFIEYCEATFLQFFDEHMKTREASRCLRGDAATWWFDYKTCSTRWDSFKDLLQERFNNEEQLAILRA
jgi:hypothetical protein